jgi:methylase of polypeptide subunit release factors
MEVLEEIKYQDITVAFKASLNGGGTTFGQEYLDVVREKFGPVDHLYEFCCGPGFIGFSLMAHDLCKKLTLSDINPDAIAVCNETINNNNLQNEVFTYVSNCLDEIPPSEKWDLVVSNPPHWPQYDDIHGTDIRRFDIDLNIHKKFYRDIPKYLKPDGSILLQENGQATSVDDFTQMIEENGLQILDVFKAVPDSRFYFIWSKLL